MLSKDPQDRPDIGIIKQHDWCRKRFPRTGKAVSAPPNDGDPLLSTTVLPYLENLHYSSPETSQVGSESEYPQKEEISNESAPPRPSSQSTDRLENRLVRKKSKTTSCIKLKNGCKTQ